MRNIIPQNPTQFPLVFLLYLAISMSTCERCRDPSLPNKNQVVSSMVERSEPRAFRHGPVCYCCKMRGVLA